MDWYQIVTESFIRGIEKSEIDSEYYFLYFSSDDGLDHPRNTSIKKYTGSVLFKFDW